MPYGISRLTLGWLGVLGAGFGHGDCLLGSVRGFALVIGLLPSEMDLLLGV
ncbi:hypothetical protein U1Q18_013915 [Sarracenia purpurea var. burkii]